MHSLQPDTVVMLGSYLSRLHKCKKEMFEVRYSVPCAKLVAHAAACCDAACTPFLNHDSGWKQTAGTVSFWIVKCKSFCSAHMDVRSLMQTYDHAWVPNSWPWHRLLITWMYSNLGKEVAFVPDHACSWWIESIINVEPLHKFDA